MESSPVIYNILIADDHQMILEGIKYMLQDNSTFIVRDEATNGEEVMSFIEAHPYKYDIVVTDITMPILSGLDICKLIKKKYPHIKVLILSMNNSTNMIKEAIKAEADGYMLKNDGKEKFIEALCTIANNLPYYSEEIIPVINSEIEVANNVEVSLNVLTKRELEILQLIVQEMTSDEISKSLFISKKTVDNHRANILHKTGCRSTIALFKYALKNGLDELK